MMKPVRCRRCGTLFMPAPFDFEGRWKRVCPRCQRPLPPTGGVGAADLPRYVSTGLVPEAAL